MSRVTIISVLVLSLLAPACIQLDAGSLEGGGGGGSSGGSTGGGNGPLRSPRAAVFAGTPYAVLRRVVISSTRGDAGAHVAVDPENPANIVALTAAAEAPPGFPAPGGSFRFEIPKASFSLAANGGNRGEWWRESFVAYDARAGTLTTADGSGWMAARDPTLAIGPRGRVYVASGYADPNRGHAIYVGAATIPGGAGDLAFTAGATTVVGAGPASVADTAPSIAVDAGSTSRAGSLHVAWERYDGAISVVVARSTDDGRTWSAPITLARDTPTSAVRAPRVAVGPTGEVYVLYQQDTLGGTRFLLSKSIDGGASFGPPSLAAGGVLAPFGGPQGAAIAVSPVDGDVYVAYALESSDPGFVAEIEFVRSEDGGASFSAPVVFHDDSRGDQLMPALSTSEDGHVHAAWIDARNVGLDVYATRSTDGGRTWAPNTRVTAASMRGGQGNALSQDVGIAARGGVAHVVWTNSRAGDRSLEAAALD